MPRRAAVKLVDLSGEAPTNGAEDILLEGEPYIATVKIRGVADYLYHAWNVEAVEAKAKAAKGSAAKKSDDLESYVYRDDDGFLAIPGHQLRGSIIGAAKYRQDPRSPRKSAQDLFKAGVIVTTEMARVGPKAIKEWPRVDRRRVTVQRAAITRARPALLIGWEATFDVQVLIGEYVSPAVLNEVITKAGTFCGLGDHHPTYGRFQIDSFSVRS